MPIHELNLLLVNSQQKEVQKRDYYQILTLKGSCTDIEKKAKKLGNNKLVAIYVMDLIKDNKSLDFLPNYVTLKDGTQIDKLNMWTWP